MNSLVKLEYELSLEDIKNICNHILDKLDKQDSSLRSRKLKIPINIDFLPSLYSPVEYEDDKKIEEALVVLIDKKIFEIEEKQKEKFKSFSEKINAKLVFNYAYEDKLRDIYKRPKYIDNWNNLVDKNLIDNIEKELIVKNKISIADKSNQEIINQIQKLLSDDNSDKSVRHVSAKYFWGLSKVLDSKEQIIKHCKLKPMPILLHVKSMSNTSKKILFIENQDTYLEAINDQKTTFKDYVLIFASGFKASSQRLRKRGGSRIFFDDECCFNVNDRSNFKKWLYEEIETNIDVYFWGDFDFSGVLIFKALKKTFPQITLYKDGYDYMLYQVKNGNGHQPIMASKETQKDPKKINDLYCDNILLPTMREHGFYDQEGVIICEINIKNV